MSVETQNFLQLLQEYHASISSKVRPQQQQEAWKKFLQIGLPTRAQENYRYVRLAGLWQKPFASPEETNQLDTEALIQERLKKESLGAIRLVFVDGVYRADLSQRGGLPKSVVIGDLHASFMQFGPFLETQWNTMLREESDPFALMNAACIQGAVFLYVPPNVQVTEPIEIVQVIAGKRAFVFPRLHIVFGRGCEVSMISHTLGVHPDMDTTVSGCLDILVEEEARVRYIEPPTPDSMKMHRLDALRVRLKRGSSFRALTATTGGALVRKSWHGGLFGEGAELFFEGAICLSGEQQAHIQILVEHEAPHCRSEQLFKAVLDENSHMSFGGNILVRRRAQKTEAYQRSQNLLLGPGARVETTPRLEIFADDVKASHGATVGQLDKEQLIYFLTRGIPKYEARRLLLAGFFQQVTERIPYEELRQSVQNQLEEAIV